MTAPSLLEHFKLRSRLKFRLEDGQIWLDENRMILVHAKAFGALRRDIIEALGPAQARRTMLRMGFIAGQLDAEIARSLAGEGSNYDVFSIGPEMHAFEGVVKARITTARIDWEQGTFFGEVDWQGSWEGEQHIAHFGVGEHTGCWSMTGYASGYTSAYFRRFIEFRETQCVCRGDPKCMLVGKPIDAWGDDAYLDYFPQGEIEDQLREIEQEIEHLRGVTRGPVDAPNLVGNSPGFKAAFDLLRKAAPSPINVLILGETGVGKELFAHWLHEHSRRADRPFVAINCGALPNELVESELFGVRKGAYTGAQESRPGRFERADGGTLFLDEIGDLSASAQVKLLRVLQTGELERLGDDQVRKVDVRVVAATHVDLRRAIAEGRFRSDLYYRLAIYPVTIPPLRERLSDIALLVGSLIERFGPVYGKAVPGVSERAMQALCAHDWPGNVRELENLVERAVLLVPPGAQIEVEHLFPGGSPLPPECGAMVDSLGAVGRQEDAAQARINEALLTEGFDLQDHVRKLLALALRRADGNMTHAARMLGITRRQLAYRLKQGPCDSGEGT